MRFVLYRVSLASLLVLASLFLGSCNPPNYPSRPIELKYYANGPWAVTVAPASQCCDSLGDKFDLYYPTNLGAGGVHHPILTWGNGTNALSSNVRYFLTHMASWGFVIIAPQDKNTGPGQTILDGANFLIAANSNSASIFYNKLDVSNVGSFGHSQGATGAINALIKSAGAIKTVMPIELPAQAFCSNPVNCANTALLPAGATIFLIDGSNDIPISPPTQPPATTGLQSIAAYYAAAPASIGKVKGTLIGPTHNDIQGQPNCTPATIPCINGVYGYLGYPTAWMMFQLQGDSYAHGAFITGTGEIFTETKNWQLAASTIP